MRKNNLFKYTSAIFILSIGILLPTTVPVFAYETASSTLVSIHLDIESATSTLFNDTIAVSACVSSASSTPVISGYCAVEQSGLDSTWSDFGGSQFLESVAGVANDNQNNIYWGWFSNLEYGQTSLDQHILMPDENLLITIGRMPLKISVSTTTPDVGATTTISLLEFGFDSSWNGVWLPAASSTIHNAGETYSTDISGQYDISIGSTTPFAIYATKENFVDSGSLTITPLIPNTEATSTTSTTTDPAPTGGSSSGGSGSAHCSVDVSKAIQFLASKQKPDGSFGPSLYTDWAAIALASGSQSSGRDKVLAYEKNFSDSLSSATDYERRAMSLMALGISPYDGTPINYIQKITDQFDGTQIGDPSLVNDDIFALFPLIKAGYSISDPMIQKTGSFILAKQKSDGSWEESPDLTAAAIQALTLISSLGGSNQSIVSARNYLIAHQQSNGGFGSSFSTSWVLQAIAALGELDSAWLKNGNSPQDALCSMQQADGGLELTTADDTTRIWATSYAIPAVLSKSWPSILTSFSRPVKDASITPIVSTSTSAISPIATSSAVVIAKATTPPVLAMVVIPNNTEIPKKKIISNLKDSSATTSSTTSGIHTQESIDNSFQLAAVAAGSGQLLLVPVAVGMFCLLGLSAGGLYLFKLIKK